MCISTFCVSVVWLVGSGYHFSGGPGPGSTGHFQTGSATLITVLFSSYRRTVKPSSRLVLCTAGLLSEIVGQYKLCTCKKKSLFQFKFYDCFWCKQMSLQDQFTCTSYTTLPSNINTMVYTRFYKTHISSSKKFYGVLPLKRLIFITFQREKAGFCWIPANNKHFHTSTFLLAAFLTLSSMGDFTEVHSMTTLQKNAKIKHAFYEISVTSYIVK